MASPPPSNNRWKPADFVSKQVPPHFVHDLMQALNAYGLASEQLRIRLAGSVATPGLCGELDVMDSSIHELESMLWLLNEYWRLDSPTRSPALNPIPLAAVFKAVVDRQSRKHSSLPVLINGLANQCVRSSANGLATLLSCLLDNVARQTTSGITVTVTQTGERIKIRVSGKKFQLAPKNPPSESPAPDLGTHIANTLATRLKLGLATLRTDMGLAFVLDLPALQDGDCANFMKPLQDEALKSRSIIILDHDEKFSGDLKLLLESWGCNVSLLSPADTPIQQDERYDLADAIFLGIGAWNSLNEPENAGFLQALSKKIFITLEKTSTLPTPSDNTDCRFLARPVSPARLRKTLTSFFSQPEA